RQVTDPRNRHRCKHGVNAIGRVAGGHRPRHQLLHLNPEHGGTLSGHRVDEVALREDAAGLHPPILPYPCAHAVRGQLADRKLDTVRGMDLLNVMSLGPQNVGNKHGCLLQSGARPPACRPGRRPASERPLGHEDGTRNRRNQGADRTPSVAPVPGRKAGDALHLPRRSRHVAQGSEKSGMNDPVDGLIIGAGAAGAGGAWSLAEAKMHILWLEQGGWMNPATYPSTGRDWEARAFGDYSPSPNIRARPEDYPINDNCSPIKVVNFNGVGGGTVMYTAHFPRMH